MKNKKNKIYDPEKEKLTSYEQSIEDSLDPHKFKGINAKRRSELEAAAITTLKELKTSRTNIRMSDLEMKKIRSFAKRAGMPYQTWITHVLHLYVSDQLIHLTDAEKMMNIFAKKTGIRK